ncbi:hypothetical protein PG279_06385 [Riemerella anatipestifer]|nr:hypothetical protein [Riemerella anatipestifer]
MKNLYKHSIDLKKITIENDAKSNFIQKLEEIEYRGYEVEQLQDGRKIVITKPGGKSVYGHSKKEDFLVYIFNPEDSSLWQITHKQILEDLKLKSTESVSETLKLIDLLERVLNGEEPQQFINEINLLQFKNGECPESIIKVYKWIWGQEDVNYPNGKGRFLSWEHIDELKERLKKQ